MGADSLLGAAVAKALSKDFKVKAVALGYGSLAAGLSGPQIEVIKGNPDDFASLTSALQGSNGCFITTSTQYEYSDCLHREVCHGKNIAQACVQAGVQHIVVSSQPKVSTVIGLASRHMDAKAEIDVIVRSTGIPVTSLVVPVLYQDFLIPPLRPKRHDHFSFAIGKYLTLVVWQQ